MQLNFPVSADQKGWFLRDVLRHFGLSSTLIRGVKRAGGFWLDDAPVHTDVRVQPGQTVHFELPPEPAASVQAQKIPLHIAYRSEHAMVLDKPAGMAVHPTLNYPDGTLANAYMGLAEQEGRCGVFRPVNRIDKDTSGLVLCAENAFAAPLLAQSVQKVYVALVQGEMPLEKGSVDAPIDRAPDSIILRQVSPNGKPSRTEYTVLASGAGHSLLCLKLLTGRTHQIRVHMAHIGHPLAGDDLYGGSRQQISRHALHCAQITFSEPITGRQCCVHSFLPPDMMELTRQMQISPVQLAKWNLAPDEAANI